MATVGVIGAGAWGTALALVAHRAGSQTMIWGREPEVIENIAKKGENPTRLPGVKFDPMIVSTMDLEEACQANILVVAVPAQYLREVTTAMAPFVPDDSYVVIASKGVEVDSRMLMSEVASQTLPHRPIGILSGPSFADEVANGLPTAVALAAGDLIKSNWLARSFNSKHFRIYPTDDVVGVQIGGALKNVLAIAAGIVEGRKLGNNAHAALVARGLAELTRLAVAKGGRVETLGGLSGIGDICLTCYNDKSRNMRFGKIIGMGKSVQQAIEETEHLTEGVATSKVVMAMAEELAVDLPVCSAVNDILNKGLDVDIVIEDLLSRPIRTE